MTPQRWQRIQRVFHVAAASADDLRDAVLARETAGDEQLRREVEKMLRYASGSGPLDGPAWDGSPLDDLPSVGSRLGPYELLEEAGSGGMGRVYKALDTRLGRTVAIKVLSAEFNHRFQAEARAISALNHPHVCSLHDIGEQDGFAYLVMEYVEGESLAACLQRGPMPVKDVLVYGAQIAGALAAAHRLGIVHRDLKPANIMITGSGIKVLDFGVAQMAASGDARDSAPQPVMGTLAYMSPSQLNGNPPDTRSDIFSLGLVLYEMVAGKQVFHGQDRAPADPLPVAKTPARLVNLIHGCLREDAARRVQSMDEVRFALQRMETEPSPKRIRGIQAAWAAALLAIALAGGVLLWNARRAQMPATRALIPAGQGSVEPPAPRTVPDADAHRTLAPPPVVTRTSYTAPLAEVAPPALVRLAGYPGNVRDPSFSPDGKNLAFSWNVRGRRSYGIFVRPISEDTPPEALTDGSIQDYGPAWSPDGRTIAFRRGGSQYGIYLVPAAGGTPALLAPIAHQAEETLPQMSWSRDGKWIAAPDKDPSGGTQIYLFRTATGEKRQITANSTGIDHAPAFSPDGKRLAFASCVVGVEQCDIYLMELVPGALKTPHRITRQQAYVRGVAWLADSKSVVYSAGIVRGRDTYLWRVSVNPPGEPERIDLAGSLARHPAVSLTGNLLAYTDFSPSNWHFMLIRNFTGQAGSSRPVGNLP